MAVGTVSSINYDDWQLITSTTPSGSSVTFNNFSGYKTLWLVGNVTKSDASHAYVRVNADSSAGSYATSYVAGQFYFPDSASMGVSFKIYDVDRTIPHKAEFSNNILTGCNPGDAYTPPNVITSIVIHAASGTFTGGTLRIYGIAS